MQSLAYTEMDQTKYCVSSMFAFRSIIRTLLHTFPIFKNRAYISVTPIALNYVNVRGGNVIKRFAREIGSGQKFVSL